MKIGYTDFETIEAIFCPSMINFNPFTDELLKMYKHIIWIELVKKLRDKKSPSSISVWLSPLVARTKDIVLLHLYGNSVNLKKHSDRAMGYFCVYVTKDGAKCTPLPISRVRDSIFLLGIEGREYGLESDVFIDLQLAGKKDYLDGHSGSTKFKYLGVYELLARNGRWT